MKAVIEGNYADIKNVKTRSVVQIVIEIPIEQAGLIQQTLGWPQPGSEIRVAVARLYDGADNTNSAAPTSEAPSPRTLDDMPYPQQAALLCKQEPFQAWVQRADLNKVVRVIEDEHDAAAAIRDFCRVSSRSEITPGTYAGDQWKKLHDAYKSEVPF